MRGGKPGAPEPIAALNRVRILETALPWMERDPLVDIRLFCPTIQTLERICPYLRREVAQRLNAAQASLPSGYRLRAHTALRTLAMQKRNWDGYFQRLREENPTWPLSALRRATNKFHAPYDQKAPPGHCTGAAVDVSLLDPEGNVLDLIAPTKGWEAADTWSNKIGPEAKRNRMIMVEAMLNAGFSNCRDEYWHYSYGDSAWAVRMGESACPYGWVHAPVVLETDFPTACAAGLSIETTRDAAGRPISAEGFCAVPPDAERDKEGVRHFAVGLYWANGTPVTLHVELSSASENALPLFAGDGEAEWQAVETLGAVERQGTTLIVRLTPNRDRLLLTSVLPPPNEADA